VRGLGTLINTSTVIVGSSIGYFIGHRIRESIRTIVVQVIGLATVIMGISNAMDTHNLVFPLVGMVIGAVIGELLHIEERLEGIGERLKKRFAKKSDDSSTFVEGFVARRSCTSSREPSTASCQSSLCPSMASVLRSVPSEFSLSKAFSRSVALVLILFSTTA
jgi:hypothetical protein